MMRIASWGCRGHSGKVKCLAWGTDDSCISSAGAEGAIYEWNLKDFKRCRENVIKVTCFSGDLFCQLEALQWYSDSHAYPRLCSGLSMIKQACSCHFACLRCRHVVLLPMKIQVSDWHSISFLCCRDAITTAWQLVPQAAPSMLLAATIGSKLWKMTATWA